MARIVVIEDDFAVRRMLRLMLEREGYEVAEAEDGNAGIEKVREAATELVITDIIMPEKEGLETIEQLRREAPATQIIAISGGGRLGPEGYLSIAKAMGAARCFSKPFDRVELLDAVVRLIGTA